MTLKLNKGLIKGGLILLIAFTLYNFLNSLFQMIMARMLSLSEYGVLAALFAIIYILAIFVESIQTIITKYSAKENNNGKLKNLLRKTSKKALKISLAIFVFYLIISVLLSYFLKINYLLLFLTGLVIFIAFFTPLTRGIMQGRKRFKALGINMVIESLGKLIFSSLFVYIGWKVYGAIFGVILGGAVSLILSLIPLRDITKSKEEKIETSGIYNYAKPAFSITALIVAFYSLDVIIAKIFFSPNIAGSYAIVSILGKIIFWGNLPITKAMFPMSAENKNNKTKSENVFANSIIIILMGIFLVLGIFYFFPEFIIGLFAGTGKVTPEAVSILFFLGIAFSLITVANVILLYKLSLGKVKGYKALFVFILIELVLLSYFSQNLYQFSIAFITASAALLWGSIVLMNE